MSAPEKAWICPFCGEQVAANTAACPSCHATIVRDPQSAPAAAQRYVIAPTHAGEKSWAAILFRIGAFILWIGGLVTGYFSARGSTYDAFDWTTFLSATAFCFIYGVIAFCVAELFENVQKIANALQRLSVIPASAPATPVKARKKAIDANSAKNKQELNEQLPWFVEAK